MKDIGLSNDIEVEEMGNERFFFTFDLKISVETIIQSFKNASILASFMSYLCEQTSKDWVGLSQ